MSISQKQTPSAFFTMGRLITQSGNKTGFKRQSEPDAVTIGRTKAATTHSGVAKQEAGKTPISMSDFDEEDEMPILKCRRTVGKESLITQARTS